MMADYSELRELFNNSELINKVSSALIKTIATILDGTSSANDRAYAYRVLGNPELEAKKLLLVLLASNSEKTVQQIKDVDEGAIQTKVDNLVPKFILASAGV